MKIAIATCQNRTDAIAADAPLLAALSTEHVEARRCVWTDTAVLWHRFDAVVIRSTWDWHVNVAAFTHWLDRIEPRTRLFNAPQTLAWGLDKRFLLHLAASNVPVVPTLSLATPNAAHVQHWAAHHGYARLILKPSLSAGSIGVHRFAVSDSADALQNHWPSQGVCLVQPYIEQIETMGEVSLVFIDGVHSHSVRKMPQAGEFRIQQQFGGQYERWEADSAAQAVATAAMAAIPGGPLIARIDMLHDGTGYRVIEAEVLEPDLYFAQAPEASTTLARALVKRLG
jgi:glutathione synthase/RimK-type ligase-like ATP-grasp enzyme